jgi:arylsulfatase A-like enzyme
VDKACESIVQELKDQGILNETMIIFTTDNGMIQGEHGLVSGISVPIGAACTGALVIR